MRRAVLALLLGLPASALPAAEVPVDIKTADGWALKGVYAPPREQKKTFILLHGAGGRKEDWRDLGRALARRGHGYLALDLRGHGESRTAPDGSPAAWRKFPKPSKAYNEFDNMRQDVQAAVDYLAGQGQGEENVGFIGAGVGASLGLKHAAVHPRIAIVVLLSPGLNYQEVTSVNAVRAYKDRPILMVYSEADKNSARSTPILYEFAKHAAGERNAVVLVAPQEHGTRMLRGSVVGQILDWIDDPVKPEPAAEAAPSEEPAAVPEAGP